MAKRDFLAVTDLTRDEILRLFDLAKRMKAGGYRETPLARKTLAMIFAKSSTRTRVSFEVGTYQLGGHALFLSSRDIQLGRGEPIADTARVLSRYVSGIMIRTFDHTEVLELARHATIPVINGLTDLSHPCQVLADLFTMREALGGWEGKRVAWVGDGNNMANSWIEAAQVLGFELRLLPGGLRAEPRDVRPGEGGGRVRRDHRSARGGGGGGARGEHGRVGVDGAGAGSGGAPPRLQGVHRGRRADEARGPHGHLPPLSPRAPRRGGHGRRHRGAAVARLGRGGEPAARPEGAARRPDGLGRWSSSG